MWFDVRELWTFVNLPLLWYVSIGSIWVCLENRHAFLHFSESIWKRSGKRALLRLQFRRMQAMFAKPFRPNCQTTEVYRNFEPRNASLFAINSSKCIDWPSSAIRCSCSNPIRCTKSLRLFSQFQEIPDSMQHQERHRCCQRWSRYFRCSNNQQSPLGCSHQYKSKWLHFPSLLWSSDRVMLRNIYLMQTTQNDEPEYYQKKLFNRWKNEISFIYTDSYPVLSKPAMMVMSNGSAYLLFTDMFSPLIFDFFRLRMKTNWYKNDCRCTSTPFMRSYSLFSIGLLVTNGTWKF